MELLQKCSVEQAYQLVHAQLNALCQRGDQPRYTDYAKILSLEDWWLLADSIKQACSEQAKNGFSGDSISGIIKDLPAEYRDVILKAFLVRKEEIRTALIDQVTRVSHATLTDFDWKVKLAIASDKLAALEQPLVAVDLDLQSPDTGHMVSIEMNKDELKKFISSLEAANKVMMTLNTS